jgi:hypothetical protein
MIGRMRLWNEEVERRGGTKRWNEVEVDWQIKGKEGGISGTGSGTG